MNIVFVNSTRKWGGVKSWTVDYATELTLRGHSVRVFGRQQEFIDKLLRAGIYARQVGFGFDYNPLTIGRFLRFFIADRPDVVIGNIGKDINTAGIAARILGIPVVQRVGLPADMDSSPRLKFLHSITKPWMLCPSEAVARGVYKRLAHIPREKVKIIHNAKKPAPGINSVSWKGLRLVSTSQVNKDKGHEQVLEALKGLPVGLMQYDIVGTGKEFNKLRERYGDLEKKGTVVWHGFSTNVEAHLSQADVFMLPSFCEGMPNSLLEAMAFGLIPIARDIGGIVEIWPDTLSEFLLPHEAGPDDIRGLLEKLSSFTGERLAELKEESLRACRENFNLDLKIDEFEQWLKTEVFVR